MGQRALPCYFIENEEEKAEVYVNRTIYDVPKALLNEFLLKNGCRDYSGITAAIIDLMCRAIKEKRAKS